MTPNYEAYLQFLTNAAIKLDDQRSAYNKGSARPRARKANEHDINTTDLSVHEHTTEHTEEPEQSEDDFTVSYEAFKAASIGTKMSYDAWKQLSNDGRKAWLGLTEQDKKALISATQQVNHDASTRTVKTHELDNDTNSLPDDDPDIDETDIDTTDNNIEANKTDIKKETIPQKKKPGDISRMLSKKGANQPSRKAKNHEIQYVVSKHEITYMVSKRERTQGFSLVDRGANGGIAGDDVRVISTTGRFVNIQGIDNHTLANMPIVTIGAYVETQFGPVIAIFNQMAYMEIGLPTAE